MNSRKYLAWVMGLAFVYSSAAFPAFTNLYVFGDSLSDSGNAVIQYNAAPFVPGVTEIPNPSTAVPGGAGYYQNRNTNGPNYADQLAALLGTGPLTASLQGGNNYAYAGARTHYHLFAPAGAAHLGMSQQVAAYLGANPVADSDALYVVFGGANNLNDILMGADAFGNAPRSIEDTVNDLAGMIMALHAAGAEHILVPNAPNIGATPVIGALGPEAIAAATFITQIFNQALASMLEALPFETTLLDTYGAFESLIANAAALGITNTTEPCFAGDYVFPQGGPVCADPSQYLFWDAIHPTYQVHSVLAQLAADAVTIAQVPEPSALLLMVSALFGLWFVRRRS
ncbi:MAG TPA: SGNH/GDSL hydrolase family protein [Burkholderiales bacterium]|nr:SGNH/GDSL hydrolase family protein [Burkholderiales bacterium]